MAASITVCLINDTSDQQNWGCQATSAALKRLIQQLAPDVQIRSIYLGALRSEYAQVHIRVVQRNVSFLNKPGNPWEPMSRTRSVIESLPSVIRRRLLEITPCRWFPKVADEFDEFAHMWLSQQEPSGMLPILQESDLVVFNGEGSILQRAPKGTRPLFLLYLAKHYLGKPCAIINHTAHLETSVPVLLAMARRVYPMMDYVSVREPASRRNLIENQVLDDVEVVPDALFADALHDDVSGRVSMTRYGGSSNRQVCISGSSLSRLASPWRPDASFEDLVAALRERDLEPVLVAKDESDQFLRNVAQRTGTPFFGAEHTHDELTALLEKSRLFISGRYHPNILSAMAGCPFLPLTANSHKIEGLCELLEYPLQRAFEFFDLRQQMPELLSGVESLLCDDQLRQRLPMRVAELAEQAQLHCARLQEVLGSHSRVRVAG